MDGRGRGGVPTGRELKAVQFGAGAIGRGFLGQLYCDAGFSTTFVEKDPALVGALRQRGGYSIHIAESPSFDAEVRNVTAVSSDDLEAIAEAVAKASIAATAVGVNALRFVAPGLAAGLRERRRRGAGPLDVIVCENLLDAGPFLRDLVRAEWPELGDDVGFVEASIGRMVPVVPPERRAADPLWIAVEAYRELPVDADAFRAPIPPIADLRPIRPFTAYVERKLFIHNGGHAVAAYLGWREGFEFIWQSVDDRPTREVVIGAMRESAEALARRRGLDRETLEDHIQDLIRRFGNRELGDQTRRVGADPVRKLGRDDRLVGAMRACLECGVEPRNLAIAARAAFDFDAPGDPSAARIRESVERLGIDGAIAEWIDDPDVRSRIIQA